jgi:hypothetical protein
MNKIPISQLQHNFDQQEEVTHVTMTFQLFAVTEGTYNATVEIYPADLGEGKTFEDMSPKALQALGRQKLSKWILVA